MSGLDWTVIIWGLQSYLLRHLADICPTRHLGIICGRFSKNANFPQQPAIIHHTIKSTPSDISSWHGVITLQALH